MDEIRPRHAAVAQERAPVVVVDDLHVKYRVFASGRAAKGARSGMLSVTRGVRTVHALKGVSFVAYENESIGVIGSNGSGKSTLMRTLTGLPPPAAGAVYARSRPNLRAVLPSAFLSSTRTPAPPSCSAACWSMHRTCNRSSPA